jgi:hypothetical protein
MQSLWAAGLVVYTFCLYVLFIQLLRGGGWLGKVFKGFRFDPELYAEFGRLTDVSGVTVTGAFERFMRVCAESGTLIFPERRVDGFEAEARVLADWLGKGKRFYRGEGGEEVNVAGRLVWLLSRVRDPELIALVERRLKESVSER